tara:strand:- start:934 stop:1731 length:798 start_codon:yes stop_codon:yes gene_type:complete
MATRNNNKIDVMSWHRETHKRQTQYENETFGRPADIVISYSYALSIIPRPFYAVLSKNDDNSLIIKILSIKQTTPRDFIHYIEDGHDMSDSDRTLLHNLLYDPEEEGYAYKIVDKSGQPVSSKYIMKSMDVVYIDVYPSDVEDQSKILTDRIEELDNSYVPPQEHIPLDVDGNRHGPTVIYDNEGNLEQIGNYHHGIKVGSWNIYDTDGSLNSSGLYVDNMKTGPWVVYYKSGIVNSSGMMNNNQPVGTWSIYNEDGSFKKEKSF